MNKIQIGGKIHYLNPRGDIACACKGAQLSTKTWQHVTCNLCKLTWSYYWKKREETD